MKRTIAAAIGGVVVAAGLSLPGVAQAATAPTEIRVIPAPAADTTFGTDTPVFAGETGFLHRRASSSPYLWTTYADRRTTVVPGLGSVPSAAVAGAGGDTVMLFASAPDHPVTDTTRQSLDLGTMTWRELPSGPDIGTNRLLGDSVLVVENETPNTAELRRLAADGTVTTTPVTGIPDASLQTLISANDGTAAVLRFGVPNGRYGLLDAASGRVVLLPVVPAASRVVLTADRIGLIYSTSVQIFDRAAVADGTATEPRIVTLPAAVSSQNVGLAGDDVIALRPSTDPERRPVLRHTTAGGEPATVSARSDNYLMQASDGVYFVGGTAPADWSVRKATATGASVVLALQDADAVTAGLTLTSGVVRYTTAQPRPGENAIYRQYATQIGEGEPGTGSPVRDGALSFPQTCEADSVCVRTVDGANTGSAYLSRDPSDFLVRSVPLGPVAVEVAAPAKLVDASPNWRLVTHTNSKDLLRTDGTKVIRPGGGVSALWFDNLWTGGASDAISRYDLRASVETFPGVSTGSTCTKTEVQATGKHLLWACGPDGPAGVAEFTGRRIEVPAGQYLLGDNYLVRHADNGDLLRYDLTTGTLGEPVVMANFPRGDLADDRSITWAVDKFGGDVAWVDADNAVHIVDPGVAPSAPVAGTTISAPTSVTLPGPVAVTAQLSRPVTSTTLTVLDVRKNVVAARITGGAARVTSTTTWDGLLEGGKRAAKGPYRWTLAATVDGRTTNIGTGNFTITCGGAPMLHSYECTGQPTLLALNSASTGQGNWQYTRNTGDTISTVSAGSELLPALTGILPYGDINNDSRNDLLVRRSDGSMRAYLGGEAPPLGNKTSVALPGNWNGYDALIHTGDLTSDGISDLVVRERESGSLFIFPGNGTGGFGAALQIPGGYKGYSRFVGVGDINLDGKADLMMQYDPTSTMYAMYGNGNGTFQNRVVISTGWLGYNAVIGAGDLNGDGLNDLLLRDTAGVLYRRLGIGSGTFGDRAVVGTGYQQYSGVY
ncbi:VCBS repeat-containing protein [Actinoplanes bogorensis]|uniref:VCBS repeat-containing protein n=1 Tax=Paractinoplanes bogorensis TaxID=1610840 RepID=A0ABS5YWF3_9ACTN|nr:FG-GAP-like repeat-containing protein [Actinoplanes bogorensis]MBU2667768.1 VCBS repeat-containing protein [Actinoplanes bogorensis]